MILLRFDLNAAEKSIYFRNISLRGFLKFIGQKSIIKITNFYGYNNIGYVGESDLLSCVTIGDLLLFIKTNRITWVDTVCFDVNKVNITVADCTEYHFNGVGVSEDYIKNMIAYFTKNHFSDTDINRLQGKYLLFKNEVLIGDFQTFDEYLSSGFAE